MAVTLYLRNYAVTNADDGASALGLSTTAGSSTTTKIDTATIVTNASITVAAVWVSEPLTSDWVYTGKNITASLNGLENSMSANTGFGIFVQWSLGSGSGGLGTVFSLNDTANELSTGIAERVVSGTCSAGTAPKGSRLRVQVNVCAAGGTMASGWVNSFYFDGPAGGANDSFVSFTDADVTASLFGSVGSSTTLLFPLAYNGSYTGRTDQVNDSTSSVSSAGVRLIYTGASSAGFSSSTLGHMLGGASTAGTQVSKIDFVTQAVSSGPTLASARLDSYGVAGEFNGYVFGGLSGGSNTSTFLRYVYSTDVVTSFAGGIPAGTSATYQRYLSGFSSATNMYVRGIQQGSAVVTNTVYRVPYATETVAQSSAGLCDNTRSISFTADTKGYFLTDGGRVGQGLQAEVCVGQSMDMATEAFSDVAWTSRTYYALGASANARGYAMSQNGTNGACVQFTYATDTMSVLAYANAGTNSNPTGTQNLSPFRRSFTPVIRSGTGSNTVDATICVASGNVNGGVSPCVGAAANTTSSIGTESYGFVYTNLVAATASDGRGYTVGGYTGSVFQTAAIGFVLTTKTTLTSSATLASASYHGSWGPRFNGAYGFLANTFAVQKLVYSTETMATSSATIPSSIGGPNVSSSSEGIGRNDNNVSQLISYQYATETGFTSSAGFPDYTQGGTGSSATNGYIFGASSNNEGKCVFRLNFAARSFLPVSWSLLPVLREATVCVQNTAANTIYICGGIVQPSLSNRVDKHVIDTSTATNVAAGLPATRANVARNGEAWSATSSGYLSGGTVGGVSYQSSIVGISFATDTATNESTSLPNGISIPANLTRLENYVNRQGYGYCRLNDFISEGTNVGESVIYGFASTTTSDVSQTASGTALWGPGNAGGETTLQDFTSSAAGTVPPLAATYVIGGEQSSGGGSSSITGLINKTDHATDTGSTLAQTLTSEQRGYLSSASSSVNSYTIGPALGGDSQAIGRFSLSSFTVAAIAARTDAYRYDSDDGASSGRVGYWFGGTNNSGFTVVSYIDGVVFSTEAAATTGATLFLNGGIALQTPATAYIMGGTTTSNASDALNRVAKFAYSTETITTVNSVLNVVRAWSGGLESTTVGYVVGGVTSAGAMSTDVDGIAFATDTKTTVTAALPNQRSSIAADSANSAQGYMQAGTNTADSTFRYNSTDRSKLVFSTETLSALTANTEYRAAATMCTPWWQTPVALATIAGTQTLTLASVAVTSNGVVSDRAGSASTALDDFTHSYTEGHVYNPRLGTQSLTISVASFGTGLRVDFNWSTAGTGYLVGGQLDANTVYNAYRAIAYSTDAASTASATLASAVSRPYSFESATKGYTAGGYLTGSVRTDTVRAFTFSNTTAATISATMPVAVIAEGVVNAPTKSYIHKANDVNDSLTSFTYATETFAAMAATLNMWAGYGIASKDYGLFGGYNDTSLDKISFSDESLSTVSTSTGPGSSPYAVSGRSKAHICDTGPGLLYSFDFTNNTWQQISNKPAVNSYGAQGTYSEKFSYWSCVSNADRTAISKNNWFSLSWAVSAATLATERYYVGGFASVKPVFYAFGAGINVVKDFTQVGVGKDGDKVYGTNNITTADFTTEGTCVLSLPPGTGVGSAWTSVEVYCYGIALVQEGYGWVVGGHSTGNVIYRQNLSTGSVSDTFNTLDTQTATAAGASPTNYTVGVIAGGANGPALDKVLYFNYSTETSSTNVWALATARQQLSATYSASKAYFAGGYNGTTLSSIERVDPQVSAVSTTSATLNVARYDSTSLQNETNGYFVQGTYSGGYSNEIDGLVFSTDVANNPSATLATGRRGAFGVSNHDRGFVSGGYNGTLLYSAERINLTIETVSTTSISASPYEYVASISSWRTGFGLGGSYQNSPLAAVSQVDNIVFATETEANLTANLPNALYWLASLQQRYNSGVGYTTTYQRLADVTVSCTGTTGVVISGAGANTITQTSYGTAAAFVSGTGSNTTTQSSAATAKAFVSGTGANTTTQSSAATGVVPVVGTGANTTTQTQTCSGSVDGGLAPRVGTGANTTDDFTQAATAISDMHGVGANTTTQSSVATGVVPVTGTSANTATQSSAATGTVVTDLGQAYFSGGSASGSAIDNFDFNDESRTTLGATLSGNRQLLGAVSSGTDGYYAGGTITGSTDLTSMEDVTFASESMGTVSATLNTARRLLTGTSSDTRGYLMGGANTTYATVYGEIDGLIFATEASNNPTSALVTPRYGMAGLQSATKGYTGGGRDVGAYYGYIESFTFATETANSSAASYVGSYYAVGINNIDIGLICGGYQSGVVAVIDGLVFTTETHTSPTATLSVARQYAAGASSYQKGYVAGGQLSGGSASNEIDGFQFSDQSAINPAATLGVAKYGGAAAYYRNFSSSIVGANTLEPITGIGNGYVDIGPDIAGAGANTVAAFTTTGAGSSITRTGTQNTTLGNCTQVGTGGFSTAPIYGTGANTAVQSVAATGKLYVVGTQGITIEQAVAGVGNVKVSGAGANTVGGVTANGSATYASSGTGANTHTVTGTATGAVQVRGVATNTTTQTSVGSGAAAPSGSSVSTTSISSAASGTVKVAGTAVNVTEFVQTFLGQVAVRGVGASATTLAHYAAMSVGDSVPSKTKQVYATSVNDEIFAGVR